MPDRVLDPAFVDSVASVRLQQVQETLKDVLLKLEEPQDPATVSPYSVQEEQDEEILKAALEKLDGPAPAINLVDSDQLKEAHGLLDNRLIRVDKPHRLVSRPTRPRPPRVVRPRCPPQIIWLQMFEAEQAAAAEAAAAQAAAEKAANDRLIADWLAAQQAVTDDEASASDDVASESGCTPIMTVPDIDTPSHHPHSESIFKRN